MISAKHLLQNLSLLLLIAVHCPLVGDLLGGGQPGAATPVSTSIGDPDPSPWLTAPVSTSDPDPNPWQPWRPRRLAPAVVRAA
jgi:hypothetical protein